MRIDNVTQFANFLSDNNLVCLDDSFLQVIQCVNSYKTLCKCHKSEYKNQLYGTCNQLYMTSVRNNIAKHRTSILSKCSDREIQFFLDGSTFITTLSR